MKNEMEPSVRRNLKDSLFCHLFSDRKRALSLYNAVNGTAYENPEELEIVTLEDVIYMHRKNDVSMLFDAKLTLFEHQSTTNFNMPLRGLLYFARNVEGLLGDRRKLLYRKTIVKIPAPSYYVLYNGTEKMPERIELRLSDAFLSPSDGYEWTAHVLNINTGYNAELMERCPELKGYTILIQYVRRYCAEGAEHEEAVDLAVKRCIEEGYLTDYLWKLRGEAIRVLLSALSEEEIEEIIRENAYEDGFEKGIRDGIERGIEQGIKQGTEQGIKQGIERGIEQGIAQGIEEGEELHLIRMICRKLERGKTPEEIADEVEEDISRIQMICGEIRRAAPESDVRKIYRALHDISMV